MTGHPAIKMTGSHVSVYLELFQVIITAQGNQLLHAMAWQLILQDHFLTGVGRQPGSMLSAIRLSQTRHTQASLVCRI